MVVILIRTVRYPRHSARTTTVHSSNGRVNALRPDTRLRNKGPVPFSQNSVSYNGESDFVSESHRAQRPFMPRRADSWPTRSPLFLYTVAVLAVIVATALRLLLQP